MDGPDRCLVCVIGLGGWPCQVSGVIGLGGWPCQVSGVIGLGGWP